MNLFSSKPPTALRTIAGLLAAALTLFSATPARAETSTRDANTIILTDTAVKNLGIVTAEAAEVEFETTFFAIGSIAEIPTNHSVVSSRVAGRVVDLKVIAGDHVTKGDVVVKVESRQAGDPPPTITLLAPASGIVAESHVRLGEPVEPSSELLDILDLTKVWAIAKVPQTEAGKLKPGSRARIRIPALESGLFEGELIRFGTTADQAAGTLDAIFLLDNEADQLRPGMRCEFSIITASRPNVLAIPQEALQGDPANRVVFIADYDIPNAYLKSPVEVGEKNDLFIEIINGVFPADLVVTKGSYLLGFAGKGAGPSLKEALDAAHGHEHAEDGSELTDEQKAAQAAEKEHGHGSAGPSADNSAKLFASTSAVLAVLLLIALQHIWRNRKTA